MLITNGAVDGADPILTEIDGRTGLIVPALASAGARSAMGQGRAALCEHLGVDVDELVALASRLQFRVGRRYQAELDLAQATMAANGLCNDTNAIRWGIDLVRRWVLDGQRELSADQIDEAVAELAETDPSAVLLVQALDHDQTPEDATQNLDWVEYFQGDSPGTRRATVAEDTYHPESGAVDDSVRGDSRAVAIVQAARAALREQVRGSEPRQVGHRPSRGITQLAMDHRRLSQHRLGLRWRSPRPASDGAGRVRPGGQVEPVELWAPPLANILAHRPAPLLCPRRVHQSLCPTPVSTTLLSRPPRRGGDPRNML